MPFDYGYYQTHLTASNGIVSISYFVTHSIASAMVAVSALRDVLTNDGWTSTGYRYQGNVTHWYYHNNVLGQDMVVSVNT